MRTMLTGLIGIAVLAELLIGKSVAAETRFPLEGFYQLPLNGAYGNDSGCNSMTGQEPVSDDLAILLPDEYREWETSCRFVAAYQGDSESLPEGSTVWTAITSCVGEGEARSGLITIHHSGDSVTITEGDKEPKSLHRCSTASHIPGDVLAYAGKLESECAASGNAESTASSKLIDLAAEGPSGKLYVVDGASTQCGDAAPLCGTGGCRTGIFKSKGGTTTKLYDDPAMGWKLSQDGSLLTINVHGSRCGGSGPDPCTLSIDLMTGKRSYRQPRH